MKFIIEKASDWYYSGEVEINTLEELAEFIKGCEHDVVINGGFKRITIYDDYLE